VIDGAAEELPASLGKLLADNGRLVTGLVERGVTRIATGRKAGGELTLLPLAEIAFPFSATGCTRALELLIVRRAARRLVLLAGACLSLPGAGRRPARRACPAYETIHAPGRARAAAGGRRERADPARRRLPSVNANATHTELLHDSSAMLYPLLDRQLDAGAELRVPLYSGGSVRNSGSRGAHARRSRTGRSGGTESAIFSQVVLPIWMSS